MTSNHDNPDEGDGTSDATTIGDTSDAADVAVTGTDSPDQTSAEADDRELADEDATPAADVEVEDQDEYSDDDEGPSRAMLVVGAAVVFVAIAIVGALIATSGGGNGGGGGGEGGGETATDARTDVGIFGTIDQFDRPDSATTLGDLGTGRPWVADTGTWGIDGDEAYLAAGTEFRNQAVIGLGRGDGGAQVRVEKVTNGAGLVFRYVGPYNYWAVVAVPEVATWNIVKVTNGTQEVVGNTGQSPTADGTTVAVRMEDDTIDVIINGRIRKTVVDDFQSEAGKVGITTKGPDAGDTRFDDFVAGLPGGIPLPAAGVGAGSGGAGSGGAGSGGAGGNGGGGTGGSSTTIATP